MTSTAHLLRTKGDQQLLGAHPNVWPCSVIESFESRLAVLKRFWPVLNRRGMPQSFPVLTVWASNPVETHCFSTSFTLS